MVLTLGFLFVPRRSAGIPTSIATSRTESIMPSAGRAVLALAWLGYSGVVG